jgi:HAT1-interacting factor 1
MADNEDTPNLLDSTTTAAADEKASNITPQERLTDLIAQAMAAYAIKDYSPAAELYSQATELQAEINGEMATENADLLYSYGKCLYFVAVRNSDVLGASSAGAKLGGGKTAQSESKPSKKRKITGESSKAEATNGTSNGISEAVPGKAISELDLPPQKEKEDANPENTPFFRITGDENWDDSDSDADGGDGEEAAEDDEEEQDDFSLAFEVLDLARILLLRKLEGIQESASESAGKGKFVASIDLTPPVLEVKERIADVYDFQAEIALEGEKYANAVDDLRSALALKEELYPFESNYVAECHYKLSLALEFGSKTQQRDSDGNPVGEARIDEAMRQESIAEMEKAIDSCQRRIKKEQVEADNLDAGPKRDKAMKDIDEVRGIVVEMDQRLTDLRADPIDAVQEASRQPEIDAAQGILKEILAGTKEEAKRKLEEASGNARDLTGLVKRKKPKVASEIGESGSATPEPTETTANGNSGSLGKRKVGFADEVEQPRATTPAAAAKRARVEDVEDSGL